MIESIYDFLILIDYYLLNHPKEGIFVIIILLILVSALCLYIYFSKCFPNSTQTININFNEVKNLANTVGIPQHPNQIMLSDLETNIKRIKCKNEKEILAALQTLRYQPNKVALSEIIKFLDREDVSEDVKKHAISTIKHISEIIKE